MKAQPVKLVYGEGYVPCSVDEATHVTLNIPGPTGRLSLPVIQQGTRAGTGCWVREVNEAYSTQECSSCHARTGPKGLSGLTVRQWTCSACQAEHDRDTNAAKNILVRGLVELENEFSAAGEAKADEAVVNEDARASGASGVGHGPLVVGILGLQSEVDANG